MNRCLFFLILQFRLSRKLANSGLQHSSQICSDLLLLRAATCSICSDAVCY